MTDKTIQANMNRNNTGTSVKKHSRLPPWIRVRMRISKNTRIVNDTIAEGCLHTVCENAQCPNRQECFSEGTATIMILGNICTRNCLFCAVQTGVPSSPDPEEPKRVANASAGLAMRHVVITSVTRDDLPDGGARHFAKTISEIKKNCHATVEVLTPDFKGNKADIETVLASGPDVYNHNLETVKALQTKIRPQAGYKTSITALRAASEFKPRLTVKSGVMVGLGETDTELFETLEDILNAGADILTIGQYLAPSKNHEPVHRFVPPEQFDFYSRQALKMGFKAVASAPLVRSSYRARELFEAVRGGKSKTNNPTLSRIFH